MVLRIGAIAAFLAFPGIITPVTWTVKTDLQRKVNSRVNLMLVSVICTVLNEGESIRRLMDSLCAQTRRPDEVVIVDGGSADSTVAILQEYTGRLPLHVLVEPGANISRGRNVAIGAATGDVIASVDAGVWLEPQWLEELVAPLIGERVSGIGYSGSQPTSNTQSPIPNPQYPPSVVAGFFVPDVQTTFEIAMAATVLPLLEDVNPATFLPSSRSVAFTKAAWAAAGGYPEWIDYCEDLIFDFRLREVAGPFAWAPEAVAHFRPRGSLKAFFKQYYRYARGRQGRSMAKTASDSLCHLSDRPSRPDCAGPAPLAGLVVRAAGWRDALLRHAVSSAAPAPASFGAH